MSGSRSAAPRAIIFRLTGPVPAPAEESATDVSRNSGVAGTDPFRKDIEERLSGANAGKCVVE